MLKLQEIKSRELKNTQNFLGEDPPKGNTSPPFLLSLKSLFVVGPSTEKSLKKVLSSWAVKDKGSSPLQLNNIRKL